MDTWSQDPRKYLVMHLKLRGGVQFSNSGGTIETSLPDVLDSTEIESWQYHLMLELDGKDQFISAVKAVKDRMGDDFEAADVWTFLYWLIDNELIDKVDPDLDEDEKADLVVIPEEIEEPSNGGWVKVPLQILTILIVCVIILYVSYVGTPMVQNYVRKMNSEELADIKAARMPQFAEKTEKEVSGIKPMVQDAFDDLPTIEPIEELVEEPTEEINGPSINTDLLNRLLEMREEMAACQIRRDEYYLLNNEDGYIKEVDRISELTKEIGQIRMGIEATDNSAAETDAPIEVEQPSEAISLPETVSMEAIPQPEVDTDTVTETAAPALPEPVLPTVPDIKL